MKITTSAQLALASAGAVFVILSASVWYSYSALRDSNEQRQQLYATVTGTAELQIRTDEYLNHFSARPLRQWRARNSAITAALSSIKPSPVALPQDIASLVARHREIGQLFFRLQSLGKPGEDRGKRIQQQLLVDRLFVMYEEQLGEVARVRQNTLQADQITLRHAAVFSVLALILLTCIFAGALFIVRRNLSVPLQKLIEATDALGGGDLNHRISDAPDNEIGALSQAVNTMAARLQTLTAELNSAHAKLQQAQKMEAIGQLTGGIAHDFNNFLAGMKGNLEVMRLRINQDRTQDVGHHIESALALTDRAAALTHRLLAFSRQQALDPRLTDVNRLIESMLPLLEHTLGPSINLVLNQQKGVWIILSDIHQLENGLLNLVINSRDAMPDGGTLTIETANSVFNEGSEDLTEDMEPGQYVCLRVIDTGVGMPTDVMARAFDPFFTTKPSGQGTGLGLSMMYGFIKQSEGHVHIDSTPGVGTTVELYLPRYMPASTAEGNLTVAPEAPVEVPPVRAARQATILVVDDEPVVRSLASEILREVGYQVLEAEDGISAMKHLQSDTKLDLLVTDIGLPNGMNGRQISEAARLQRPGLSVLFITGYAQNTLAANDMLGEGMQLMTKPFSLASFVAKVRSMVDAGVDSQNDGESEIAVTGTARSLKILVVDDNQDAADNLAMLLEAIGHTLQIAHDGGTGLEMARSFTPDVVFLDIGMPVMDGFETARCIRETRTLPNTILVALTGWSEEAHRVRAKEAGFDHYLTKPTDLSTIETLLSRLMQ